MRETENLNFYRNLMKHEVTVDRNKTAPRCRNCCYFHPDFKYRRCLYSICPYGKPENEVFRQKPLPRDKFSGREVVIPFRVRTIKGRTSGRM